MEMNLGAQYRSFESAAITIQSSDHRCHVICIYRPRRGKKNPSTINDFIRDFENLLHELKQSKCPFYIVTDFNIHFDNKSDSDTKRLISLLTEHDMNQLIIVPPHRCGHTLHYLITSCSNSLIFDHQVFDKAISDHFLIIADIDISKPKQEKRTVTSRNLKQLDTSVLKDMLKNCLSTTTVENADHLNQAMKTAIDHCAPVRTRTISARPISPWFRLEIKEAKRLCRQAERKWRKTKLQVHRDIFTHHRDRVNSIVEEKKKTYYVNQLQGMTSCKELFQVTDCIFGNEKTTAFPCTGSDKELCHQFSTFFDKKIENIRSQLGSEPPSQSYASVFSGHLLNTFSPVNECDVLKIITKSAPKSCDLDYIPTHILMSCIYILLP
ncbi:RNA-directed DNA polymerase from mobile element jockey [Plakobranchus ocellatus]|uniref:RNA-directed DNA polymerase from mobile element jockey n=1 Tax=Plakobranchus ocellatus TaxID=259542 RepID=A0AAV4BJB7_9GAST|nr:RNA-directed DNA polymerase from mobile element jockey [Plakobranchus ocellatus]